MGAGLGLCLSDVWRVCLGGWSGSLRIQDLPECWLWSSGRVLPAFSCFALGASLVNMALFRVFRAFLEGFGVVVWVCVVCMLCVDCGAFVRVWS